MICLCPRCGKPAGRKLSWCDDCGALLPSPEPTNLVPVLKLFAWCCAIVAVIFALLALNGCGEPFRADLFSQSSTAGAGGHPQTLPQAGAGGRDQTNQAGGSPPVFASAGASVGGAPNAGAGGSPAQPAPDDAGAGSSGAANADCLNDWRGSSCDTCSSSSDDAGAGRTCRAVLDCYVERHCTGATCANACDYNEPTGDEAVKLAQAVLACRCGGAP